MASLSTSFTTCNTRELETIETDQQTSEIPFQQNKDDLPRKISFVPPRVQT
jgi:hypothetical protein